MSFIKFKNQDVFYNLIETHPQYNFYVYDNAAYYNKGAVHKAGISGSYLGSYASTYEDEVGWHAGVLTRQETTLIPRGYISLYEMNVMAPELFGHSHDAAVRVPASRALVSASVTPDGSRTAFKTVAFNDVVAGERIVWDYPLTASISRIYIPEGTSDYAINPNGRDDDGQNVALHVSPLYNKRYANALKASLNKDYGYLSHHYAWTSSVGDYHWHKGEETMNMICIPSIFYGSTIEKGSVDLKFYITGSVMAQLTDSRKNGELIEQVGSDVGSVAGVVMYDHGLILLTGSWDILTGIPAEDNKRKHRYEGQSAGVKSPKWIHFGAGLYEPAQSYFSPNGNENSVATETSIVSASFGISFRGTNKIPSLTMMAHAPKARLNYSRNPTFIDNTDPIVPSMDPYSYRETGGTIKNTSKSPYVGAEANFQKQVFISKIGIYDENKELIGIASLANPVRKTETRDYTFKIKLDF